jgi:hypothetical protein
MARRGVVNVGADLHSGQVVKREDKQLYHNFVS